MIEFKHVDKVYPNGVQGLKDINLTIDQGEFVAIIGLSGAGKSTLIRTINRMIDATGGELTVDGVNVMSLRGRAMRRYRRKIGMIFQSYNLVTRSTAIRNVLTSMVPDMPWWRVILADEPVAALDPITAKQVMSDFKHINEDMNITVLINIHHVDLALNYCTRVIGIRAGEIVYDGPTTEVTQEILDDIYNGAAIPTAEK